MLLTRKISFSAAHACRNPVWTDEVNVRMYGSCALGTGHGHDYLCELAVAGRIDPQTGIVVNLVDIKQRLKRVVGPLDSSHLNVDDPAFRDKMPTTERLAVEIWNRLLPAMNDCELFSLRLHETRTRRVEYRGDPNMVDVTRRVEFNSAHRLHSRFLSDEENARIFGKCNNPMGHGHNYELEVTVRGAIDERTGMVIGIGELDEVIQREIVERYDHKNLNLDLEEFQTVNPTSEEFARVIWSRLASCFTRPALYRVRLVETGNNSFEYYGE
ncbi:MAG: 6-carboxytetrahydropterin synthase [candidate division Zixibacteria bacterium]|nr:6-carboxytetrahydropterin synthase [candidate division Zixibacteria bacterium]